MSVPVPGLGDSQSPLVRRVGAAAPLLLTLELLALSGAWGCTSDGHIGDDVGRIGDDVARIGVVGPDAIEGVVRRVGNAPFTRTIVEGVEGERAVVVEGPYEPEVRRLIGAQVRVTGRTVEEGGFPGPALEASSYEVVSVDGERPLLGTLDRDEDGFYLELRGREVARLAFVPEELAESLGVVMWVILDANDGVARYGVLRDPT